MSPVTISSSEVDLLRRHAPMLQHDSHEFYYADAASTLTDTAFDGGPMAPYANVLRREDGTVIAEAGHGLNLELLRADRYADGPEVRRGDVLDGAGSQYVRSLVGFGVHEGDWEGIQVRIDGDGNPEDLSEICQSARRALDPMVDGSAGASSNTSEEDAR